VLSAGVQAGIFGATRPAQEVEPGRAASFARAFIHRNLWPLVLRNAMRHAVAEDWTLTEFLAEADEAEGEGVGTACKVTWLACSRCYGPIDVEEVPAVDVKTLQPVCRECGEEWLELYGRIE